MKKLIPFLFLLCSFSALAQLPPIVRNYYTTNLNPVVPTGGGWLSNEVRTILADEWTTNTTPNLMVPVVLGRFAGPGTSALRIVVDTNSSGSVGYDQSFTVDDTSAGEFHDQQVSLPVPPGGRIQFENISSGGTFSTAGDAVLIYYSFNSGGGSPSGNAATSSFATNAPNGSAIASGFTNSIVYVRTNGNNSTAIRGRDDLPFLTIAAAQVAMQGNQDVCDVGTGIYSESVYRLGTYRLARDAYIFGDLFITNGTIYLEGNGTLYAPFFFSTNGTLLVKNFGLLGLGYVSGATIIGATNSIRVTGCEVVYSPLIDADTGYGITNTSLVVNADFIASVGTWGTNSTVVLAGRRLENKLGGPIVSTTGYVHVYSTANVALFTDHDQFSVELGAQLISQANVFTGDKEECSFFNGGVTPETDLGTPSATYGTNVNFGSWLVSPSVEIPSEPLTRFSSFLGF